MGSGRSDGDCKVRWHSHLKPLASGVDVAVAREWTDDDHQRLQAVLLEDVERDWTKIAAKMGDGRTPIECLRFYKANFDGGCVLSSTDCSAFRSGAIPQLLLCGCGCDCACQSTIGVMDSRG